MKEPIRILQVLGGTSLGGAESRIMDCYRCMNRDAIQFDFMVHTKDKGYYEKEILELGGRIYRVPSFRIYNFFAYQQAWKKFFAEHKEFQCIHGHITSSAALYLPLAKKSGIPVTIAHVRSAGVDKGIKGWLTKLLRLPLKYKTDYCFACSKEAGIAVYGTKWMEAGRVKVLPNAIDIQKYDYNNSNREKIRKELKIENNFVIGHVGSFRYAKNHEYLIRVFVAYVKLDPTGKLMLLGEGNLFQSTKDLVEKYGIKDNVIFLGNQINTSSYYQAMDMFVFPSRYEGLPGTVVEAETTGLKCLISTNITKDVIVTDIVETLDITIDPQEWAKHIYETRNYKRIGRIKEMQQAGFDVREQVKWYEKFYVDNKN